MNRVCWANPEVYPCAGHREVKRRFRSPMVDVDDMLLCFGEKQDAARRSYLQSTRLGVAKDGPELRPAWHSFGASRGEQLDPELVLYTPFFDWEVSP